MKISALHIARLCSEFQSALAGAEVLDLSKDEVRKTVTIHFVKNTQKYCLIFHFGMAASFIYLLDYIPRRIITTNFLPQLRGCSVLNISQPIFDRILRFDLEDEDAAFTLMFELFGHSSNLYLLGRNNSVVTTLRKAKQDVKKYGLPESPGGFNPLDFDPIKVIEFLEQNPDMDLRDVFTTLDDYFFDNLYVQLGIDGDIKSGELDERQISAILQQVHSKCSEFVKPATEFYYRPDKRQISLCEREDWEISVSLSSVLSEFSRQEKQPVKKISERKQSLEQVKRLIKRDSKKLENLKPEFERVSNFRQVRRKAEILSANLRRVKTGMGSVELPDYEAGENAAIKIELSRSLSPGRNVEHLFAKAKKLQDKIPTVRKEISETERRLSALNALREKLTELESDSLPDDIKTELSELGIVPKSAREKSGEPAERLPYKQYTTSLGDIVLVGRSAADNDQLTFKVARKYDLWLHSQQTSGSHVVLRRPNRTYQFQKKSIIEAAQIAAFFSTAKGSDSVPVIYTEVRYVRKARKGSPGQVIADRTKSVLVEPCRPKN